MQIAATLPVEAFATARLTAERLSPAHLEDLVPLHLDEEVSRYLGGVRSREQTKAYLAANLAHWDRYGFGLWVFRNAAGVFVGRAGIRRLEVDGVDEIEIAYTLARPFWGQGLASEIAAALTEIGLGPLALPQLVGIASVENTASRRVLEKSGFALEGVTLHHGEKVAVYRRRA
jgi:RimJ/RimL family protein N-acetyltransferase